MAKRLALFSLVGAFAAQAAPPNSMLLINVKAPGGQAVDLELTGPTRAKVWKAQHVEDDATRKGHALMARRWWVFGGRYTLKATGPRASCEGHLDSEAAGELFGATVTVTDFACTITTQQFGAAPRSNAAAWLRVAAGGAPGQRLELRVVGPRGAASWSTKAEVPASGVVELEASGAWCTGPGAYRLTAAPPAPLRPCEATFTLEVVPSTVQAQVRPTPEGCAVDVLVEPGRGLVGRKVGDFPPHEPQRSPAPKR